MQIMLHLIRGKYSTIVMLLLMLSSLQFQIVFDQFDKDKSDHVDTFELADMFIKLGESFFG